VQEQERFKWDDVPKPPSHVAKSKEKLKLWNDYWSNLIRLNQEDEEQEKRLRRER